MVVRSTRAWGREGSGGEGSMVSPNDLMPGLVWKPGVSMPPSSASSLAKQPRERCRPARPVLMVLPACRERPGLLGVLACLEGPVASRWPESLPRPGAVVSTAGSLALRPREGVPAVWWSVGLLGGGQAWQSSSRAVGRLVAGSSRALGKSALTARWPFLL
jgi:hypothetical protein